MQRYNRNILLIGDAGQTKLLNSRVLVCGCGGLGSTVIMNLAGLGIGTIGLVDDDVVEITNLNRQFIHKNIGEDKVISAKNRILEYNPEITVNTYKIRLDENNYQSIVKDYDIIISAIGSPKEISYYDPNYFESVPSSNLWCTKVIIDVGINVDENGNLCGDVDIDSFRDCERNIWITPTPGGIGKLATVCLFSKVFSNAVNMYSNVEAGL